MNIIEYQVKVKLTPKLAPLLDIAYNLWWSWTTDAAALYEGINKTVWDASQHNPIQVLASLSQLDCKKLEEDTLFMSQLKHVHDSLKNYLKAPKWYYSHSKKADNLLVAYFSLEYGIHESLPLYSGGLGILSGDHCKSASDIGIPFIAVGLLYRNGYFKQYTNSDGWQQERYGYNEFYSMPIKPVKTKDNKDLYITIPMLGREMKIKVWKMEVGLISMYFLDTDIAENHHDDRVITGRLYSGDSNMRIRQETVLGIGGITALSAIGLNPTVYHLNEGHPAFVGFARLNNMIRSGVNPTVALQIIKRSTLFTTHTPVPAGFDMFSNQQIATYIEPIFAGTDFTLNQIMALGKANPFREDEPFNMAIAGLRMSAFRNGVSKLHGEVSRKMFQYMWSHALVSQVPIGHITNGVHLPTYTSSDFKRVFYQYLTDRWIQTPQDTSVWEKVKDIPNSLIYETKNQLRIKLISFARKRMKAALKEKGVSAAELMECDEILNPNILTIGFARRFATYKRATLLFTDEARLLKIINNPEMPVQFIFAGKAHPNDNEGKEFIKRIIHISSKPEFRKRIVFIEDYDIEVAKRMTSGVDIWLNNPRRPLEASGTSGMKAAANGALNFSVLDGWWVEGYNGENGFAIGAGEEYDNSSYQDYVESRDLYNKLEAEIIPLFYQKERSGLPDGWLNMIKNTLATCPAFFNTTRMLIEYTDKYYIPLHNMHVEFCKNDNAESFLKWRDHIVYNWDSLQIYNCSVSTSDFSMGEKVRTFATIKSDAISHEDYTVYTVVEYNGESGKLEHPTFIPMTFEKSENHEVNFIASFTLAKAGKVKFSFAVVPTNKFITHLFEGNLIKWN